MVAEAPLASLGLDSLGGMELRTALEQRLGLPVPLSGVAEGLSLDILARRIVAQMRTSQPEAVATALLAQHEPPAAHHGLARHVSGPAAIWRPCPACATS